jgi:hypothetical protein
MPDIVLSPVTAEGTNSTVAYNQVDLPVSDGAGGLVYYNGQFGVTQMYGDVIGPAFRKANKGMDELLAGLAVQIWDATVKPQSGVPMDPINFPISGGMVA